MSYIYVLYSREKYNLFYLTKTGLTVLLTLRRTYKPDIKLTHFFKK